MGRDRARLDALATEAPGRIHVVAADLSAPSDVDRLIDDVGRIAPDLSLLVNNAGLQSLTDLTADTARVDHAEALRRELSVNLDAIIQLCIGLAPSLKRQPSAAIVNVSSALAIAPKASAPVYCAAKAGLSAFTRALRYQFEDRAPNVRVVDAIMGLVNTDMTAGRGRGKITPERAAHATLKGLEEGRVEYAIAQAALLRRLHRLAPGLADRVMRNA